LRGNTRISVDSLRCHEQCFLKLTAMGRATAKPDLRLINSRLKHYYNDRHTLYSQHCPHR
ncbi:hypothetical protein J4G07_16675, partial [Candidatus Poribacteria bacterium]|nr:hypothetical protein [Candidatus Poribacteria bacterium]